MIPPHTSISDFDTPARLKIAIGHLRHLWAKEDLSTPTAMREAMAADPSDPILSVPTADWPQLRYSSATILTHAIWAASLLQKDATPAEIVDALANYEDSSTPAHRATALLYEWELRLGPRPLGYDGTLQWARELYEHTAAVLSASCSAVVDSKDPTEIPDSCYRQLEDFLDTTVQINDRGVARGTLSPSLSHISLSNSMYPVTYLSVDHTISIGRSLEYIVTGARSAFTRARLSEYISKAAAKTGQGPLSALRSLGDSLSTSLAVVQATHDKKVIAQHPDLVPAVVAKDSHLLVAMAADLT